MKIHDLVISTVLATTAIDGHTSNPPDTMHTVEAVSANIERLCEDPAIQAKIMHPEDVCQVSLDDGKTWINVTEALLALILAGSATYMIRRRKIKDDGSSPEPEPTGDGSAPETEPTGDGSSPETEPTGDGSAPETEPTGDGSAPERQEKVILEPEPDTWILTNQLQLYSRFARINPDVRYGIKDITNAKEILQILITAERNVLWESPLEWSNDLLFLERLQETLWSNGFTYNRDIILGIQIIFAIAKQEGEIVSIPEPSQE